MQRGADRTFGALAPPAATSQKLPLLRRKFQSTSTTAPWRVVHPHQEFAVVRSARTKGFLAMGPSFAGQAFLLHARCCLPASKTSPGPTEKLTSNRDRSARVLGTVRSAGRRDEMNRPMPAVFLLHLEHVVGLEHVEQA